MSRDLFGEMVLTKFLEPLDKEQPERDWVLGEFKSGASPIMVATDVASRGLGSLFRNFPSGHEIDLILLLFFLINLK